MGEFNASVKNLISLLGLEKALVEYLDRSIGIPHLRKEEIQLLETVQNLIKTEVHVVLGLLGSPAKEEESE